MILKPAGRVIAGAEVVAVLLNGEHFDKPGGRSQMTRLASGWTQVCQ